MHNAPAETFRIEELNEFLKNKKHICKNKFFLVKFANQIEIGILDNPEDAIYFLDNFDYSLLNSGENLKEKYKGFYTILDEDKPLTSMAKLGYESKDSNMATHMVVLSYENILRFIKFQNLFEKADDYSTVIDIMKSCFTKNDYQSCFEFFNAKINSKNFQDYSSNRKLFIFVDMEINSDKWYGTFERLIDKEKFDMYASCTIKFIHLNQSAYFNKKPENLIPIFKNQNNFVVDFGKQEGWKAKGVFNSLNLFLEFEDIGKQLTKNINGDEFIENIKNEPLSSIIDSNYNDFVFTSKYLALNKNSENHILSVFDYYIDKKISISSKFSDFVFDCFSEIIIKNQDKLLPLFSKKLNIQLKDTIEDSDIVTFKINLQTIFNHLDLDCKSMDSFSSTFNNHTIKDLFLIGQEYVTLNQKGVNLTKEDVIDFIIKLVEFFKEELKSNEDLNNNAIFQEFFLSKKMLKSVDKDNKSTLKRKKV